MELAASIQRAKSDPQFFCEKLLKIVHNGRISKWEYNLAQRLVLEARLKQERAGKPVRLVIIKARREGVSTEIQGWLFQKATTNPYRTGMVVSHEQDSADEIAEISRRFWELLPDGKRPSIPGSKLPHTKTLVFDKLRSKIKIETAMDVNIGRSMALDYIHASEVAFWRNAETLMLGLLQCVDDRDLDTMVVIESTANGIGGYFYNVVQKALNGENDYELVFLPWFIDDRYQLVPPADFVATREEEKVRTLYTFEGQKITLTDGQLYWRRHTIDNKCNGDQTKFRQEYPGSVDEAFVYSGNTRFDQDTLKEIESEARPHIFKGFLHEEPAKDGFTYKLEKNDKGYLSIYEKPVHQGQYVFFADVSEGIDVTDKETDYSCIDILRCDTMEQVAHWHGKLPPEKFQEEVLALARYYNDAFGTPEKNSIGHGVVAWLKDQYSKIYIRMKHDRNGNPTTKEFGWRTTTTTKPIMIKGLAGAILDKEIKINNPGTFEELRRFSTINGELRAPDGLHDDRVISLAGAVQMYIHWYSKPVDDEPEDEDEDDDDPSD